MEPSEVFQRNMLIYNIDIFDNFLPINDEEPINHFLGKTWER
jgi:hypothetical protein